MIAGPGLPAPPGAESPAPGGKHPSGRAGRWLRRVAVGGLFGLVLLALSVVTVRRLSAANIAADAILQSVMSVQDVDWFFWGQNRFASVVPLLVSPIADPDANLFACQMVNALSFFGLLLLMAGLMAPWLAGRRSWPVVLAVFLTLAGASLLIVKPLPLYFMALDAQPYSLSWLLGLAAFALWRRGRALAFALAAALSWVAIGLNPSVVLGVAALAVVEMVRRRQWLRWPALGAVWLAGLASWTTIAARFPPTPGPVVYADPDYYSFRPDLFAADARTSAKEVLQAFDPGPTALFVALAALGLLAIPGRLCRALLGRAAAAAAFAAGYWVVFTGNPWVDANGSAVRYFYPVVLIGVVMLAAPIAAELHSLRLPAAVPTAVAATACAIACVGPQTPVADAPVLRQVDATADAARAAGAVFVAGSYWYAWPVLHRLLADGRDAAFATALRSGGDPAAYRRKLDDQLRDGTTPRALCVNDSVDSCVSYLTYWTAPGWSATPAADCPAPDRPDGPGTCQVLEYTGPSSG